MAALTDTPLESALARLIYAGEALGDARAHVDQLGDQYPVLKEMAIIRVMERDKISSHAAKDIVKTDVAFMEHRVAQRVAGVAVCRAEAEYEAAKAAATQASLTTPSMIELETKIKATEKELRTAKVMIEQGNVAYRRSNSMLSDRISDVERLTDRNRKFWDLVDAIVPRPIEVYDAWEQSKDQGTFAIVGLEATR